MKSLGVVRKIDELGRIVIPMEVRKSQNWHEGQVMEMFMDESNLVMRPYRKNEEIVEAINTVESFKKAATTGEELDTDKLDAALSVIKNYL